MRLWLAALAALALALAAAWLVLLRGDDGEGGTAAAKPSGTYSLAATRRCLHREGARVAALERADERRAALADLAQRRSIEARFGKKWIALGFARDEHDAQLLAELLVVPDDPYLTRVRGNVVALYPPESRSLAGRAIGCLR